METAEEIQAALDEANAAGAVGDPAPAPSEQPAAPAAPALSQAEMASMAAAAAAKAVADHFGATRIEGTPTPAQRRLTTKEKIAAMTPEQRAELEQRLITGGAAAAMELAEMISRDELAAFEERAQPMVASTGSLLVDSFKARMYQEDRYAKQIAPLFDKAMANVNKSHLVGLNDAERYRQLKTYWEAAASDMFRAAAASAPPPARPPVVGGQRGGASSGPAGGGGAGPKSKMFEKGDDLQRLAESLKGRGLINDEDLAWAEANYEDAIF